MNEIMMSEQYPVIVLISTVVIGLVLFLPVIFHKMKSLKSSIGVPSIADKSLEEALAELGYNYDATQDIFYTGEDAWQKEMGYCRVYDEAAAPLSIIIDCEPIYFEYKGKRWLIEFWKGQYGISTGAEIGVYSTDGPDIQTRFFNGTFYECVDTNNFLNMSYVLRKNGKKLIQRKGTHWWLTGFKLGEFSEPSELTLDITITLNDEEMRDEFIKGLKKAGYLEKEIVVINNTVRLLFGSPRTQQPYSRNEFTEYIMQSNNRELCSTFNEVTIDYFNSMDKLLYFKEEASDVFEEFFRLGRHKDVFESYWRIKKDLL